MEVRTIKAGRNALEAIERAETFTAWMAIGKALCIGKAHALRVTGANAAWGRNYSRAFSSWMKANGFQNLPPPTRSHAIEMAEHEAAIIAWRDGLPERQKRRLIHPQSVTQRWRAATISPDARSPADLRRDATAAMAKILHLRRRPAAGSSHPALASRKEARGPSIRCAGCRVPRGHDGSITVTQNRELQEFSFCSILRILIKKL